MPRIETRPSYCQNCALSPTSGRLAGESRAAACVVSVVIEPHQQLRDVQQVQQELMDKQLQLTDALVRRGSPDSSFKRPPHPPSMAYMRRLSRETTRTLRREPSNLGAATREGSRRLRRSTTGLSAAWVRAVFRNDEADGGEKADRLRQGRSAPPSELIPAQALPPRPACRSASGGCGLAPLCALRPCAP